MGVKHKSKIKHVFEYNAELDPEVMFEIIIYFVAGLLVVYILYIYFIAHLLACASFHSPIIM